MLDLIAFDSHPDNKVTLRTPPQPHPSETLNQPVQLSEIQLSIVKVDRAFLLGEYPGSIKERLRDDDVTTLMLLSNTMRARLPSEDNSCHVARPKLLRFSVATSI
eukprot:861978-Amphidinium_carterae.1